MEKMSVFIVCILMICSCNVPEKEKAITSDSTAYDSARNNQPLADTLTIDSLKAESVFSQSDSQTYYLLKNYIADAEIKLPPTDLQTIDSTCAVIVYPTDEQLKTLQTDLGDNFMQLADTYSYYQGSAIEMLDSIDVGTINAEKPFLNFKGKKRRTWKLDIRKEGAPAWNLIFFNINKEPEIIAVKDLSHDRIMEYFDKKPQ